MTTVADSQHDELLTLYEVSVNDLSYFKTQQWTSTNYFFLLTAGLVGVRQVAGPEMPKVARILMVVLALVITVAQIHTLRKLEDSIKRRRQRLSFIREQFTPLFRAAWEAGGEKPEDIKSIWYLRVAVVAGWGIVSWLLLSV